MPVVSYKTILFLLLCCACSNLAAASWFRARLYSDLTFQAKLESGMTGDSYASGGVAVIGNTAAVSSAQGVYVYELAVETWTQRALLVPSDGLSGCDFPRDIALLEGVLFLGCPSKAVDGKSSQGAVYAFNRTEIGWTESQRLIASDGGSGDQFGRTLSANGDRLIVGAHGHRPRGAVYSYSRTSTGWVEEGKLLPTDDVTNFGQGVQVDGDTIAVFKGRGATAPVIYLFKENLGNWESQGSVSVCEPSACCCNFGGFGKSFALKNDTLVVGNSFLTVGSNSAQGGAYVFIRDGGTWVQSAKLIAEDGQFNSLFGTSASVVSNTKLIIGAQGDFTESGGIHGSVYMYEKENGTWIAKQTLHSDGAVVHRDEFGSRLFFDSGSLIVAAPVLKGTGPFQGAAFIYSSPGAGAVIVSGRVLTSAGRGLGNASVSIAGNGLSKTVLTNALGFYSFTEIPSGATYTVNVRSKRYRFAQRSVEVNAELNDVDFTGIE